jgi:adenylate cyclase
MSQRRKLAAILSADVAGYSRLMGDDDLTTISTLTAYRKVFAQHIAQHEGRVVDSPGDALLAEFSSAIEAVNGALEIQRELAGRNAPLPEHRKMHFRIGVNLGDVTEQEGALYGDGVNIAARLESLAEPGGMCVSGSVYDQIEGRVAVPFRFVGEQPVKNIAKPVRVYQAVLDFAGNSKIGALPLPYKSRRLIIAFFIVSILSLGAMLWHVFGNDLFKPPVKEDPVLALPSGPAIAVLPFTNLDRDSSQEYFSDGLTEEIITGLARVRDLHVLARNTTFQYKGQAVDVPAVGRKLGVQYMLEGSVRKSADRIRITAQLIDTANGSHLWAERYDRQLQDIFAVQDDITNRIVGAITGNGGLLRESARSKVAAKAPGNLDAYELVLRATAEKQYTQKWYEETTAMLERAIQLDPNYARAHQEYAWLKLNGWIFRFEKSTLPSQQIKQNAIKAVDLDSNDALAHRTAAYGYFFDHQLDLFYREAQLALELAPFDASIFAELGMAILFTGQWERGISLVSKAYQLNPASADGWYSTALHYDFYRKGQYAQALEAAIGHNTQALCETQWKYVAAYGQLQQPDKAKQHWDNCVATVHGFSADWVAQQMRIWNFQESFIQKYMEGIQKAGYPCNAIHCGATR